MVEQVFPLLSAGADGAILVISIVVLRMERRISRLEYKIFGFDVGAAGKSRG